jgi:flagellar basal-body rod modification protein FlgD
MTSITNATPSILEGLGLTSKPEQKESKELGQADFLQLMVAQLENQDPFKPLESGEFLGELAQFSTVSGIQALQDSFSGLTSALQSVQALQASSLVGREVLVQGDTAVLPTDGGLVGMADLATSTGSLTVSIYDLGGNKVKDIRLGAQGPGRVQFEWDGVTDTGRPAAPGNYRVRAEAVVDGRTTAVDTLIRADVESVTLGQGGREMTLNLSGLGPLALSQVSEIY